MDPVITDKQPVNNADWRWGTSTLPVAVWPVSDTAFDSTIGLRPVIQNLFRTTAEVL